MATSSPSCSYLKCKNRRKIHNISFFKFPVNDEQRCTQWLISSGNYKLFNCDSSVLKSKLICEEHFLPKYILHSGNRRLLSSTAVPIRYTEVRKTGKFINILV